MNSSIKAVFDKYSKYDYIDADVASVDYHIKSKQEFNNISGGVSWDFVGPICDFLHEHGIISYCFFTGIYRDEKMIASHTYVIVSYEMKSYWVECAWQNHIGIHEVNSFSDIEELLKVSCKADEVHTSVYNPSKTYELTTSEFLSYIEQSGVELS